MVLDIELNLICTLERLNLKMPNVYFYNQEKTKTLRKTGIFDQLDF
jgi:hypothetical protein